MMTTNKAAMLTLFFCLSNLTVHGMNQPTHTANNLQDNFSKKTPKPTHNPNAQKRSSNQRVSEREKAIQLNKDRNKKLYHYLSSDEHL